MKKKRKRVFFSGAYISVNVILVVCICGVIISMLKENNEQDSETEGIVVSESTEASDIENVSEEASAEEGVEEDTQEETEEAETADKSYTFTELNETMYVKEPLNVRNLPSVKGERLSVLNTAQEVKVTGQCNETGWYRILFNGSDAYVSNRYLSMEKPE